MKWKSDTEFRYEPQVIESRYGPQVIDEPDVSQK